LKAIVFSLGCFFGAVSVTATMMLPDLQWASTTSVQNSSWRVRDFEFQKPVFSVKSLSEVLEMHLDSLDFESLSFQEKIQKQAKDYLRLKKNKSLYFFQKMNCMNDFEQNPYCAILGEIKQVSRKKEKPWRSFNYSRRQILTWIKNASWVNLENLHEGEFSRALHLLNHFSKLEKLTQVLLQLPSRELHIILAVKLEEFLPDSSVKEYIIRLYESGVRATSTLVPLARFRLGLFYIWNQKYDLALQQLKLLEVADSDYSSDYESRALYWQYRFLKENTSEKERVLKKMIQKYPLSFHSILMQKDRFLMDFILSQEDSEISLEISDPKIMKHIKLIDALLRVRAFSQAKEVMNLIAESLEKVDPKFRLYIAIIYSRMKESIEAFKVLNSVFRDQPKLFSKKALKVYYPRDLSFIDSYPHEDLLIALIRQESAFNPHARSQVGALGLMQLMPQTVRLFEKRMSKQKLYDPESNVRIGSRYFEKLLEYYQGNASLALAAYNAGLNHVDRWQARYPFNDPVLFLDLIPFKETRNYVAFIGRNYFWYKMLYSKTLDFQKFFRESVFPDFQKLFHIFDPSGKR